MDMEIEGPSDGNGAHQTAIRESSPGKKLGQDAGCFDCNICLDFAVEPVVTLCGHLYCWPCIYRWLRLESATPQQCPVCKAALSHTALVPLYGRGHSAKRDGPHHPDIPSRPSVAMTAQQQQQQQRQRHHHHFHHHHNNNNGDDFVSTAPPAATVLHPTMLGGTAIAVLPWVFGDQLMGLYCPSNPYHLLGSGGRGGAGAGAGDSPRLRRQEMQASRSLNRISFFLFCCVVLCLLFF